MICQLRRNTQSFVMFGKVKIRANMAKAFNKDVPKWPNTL